MQKMFCFQCEQTVGCTGCTGGAGACGKSAALANRQDEMTGALIGLARALQGNEHKESEETTHLFIEGLYAGMTNVNFDMARIDNLIAQIRAEKARLAPECGDCSHPCGRNDEYDMRALWSGDADVRSLKSLILFGLRGMAAYLSHGEKLGREDKAVNAFLPKALRAVGEDYACEGLLPIALEVGRMNYKCMALLDEANRAAFGTPEPTKVNLGVEKGPFIVVTGHDLCDLQCLLEQSAGKGVNVYTHGEMLPAHAYPELKKYPHLKGNFGSAWQNQRREFENLPAPILFTANCLTPPDESYAGQMFTSGPVAWPGARQIQNRDFTPLIEAALRLGGYQADRAFFGPNGGTHFTTGFGFSAVLGAAEKIISAVKAGKIRHFFLVAGCDGVRENREYYAEFVRRVPGDCIVLTLACGKYRFNDMDLGEIEGIPRLLDMGQCNDAYSAIQVALALAEAFQCGVNELPLSMVLSWYEQKAVSILLTLLSLGVKNILLGPSLPAFVSPAVLGQLVENYGIAPISTPEADLERLLGK